MSSSSDPLEVILSSIEVLDEEMASHETSCEECKEHGPCRAWVDMVETWNFYYTSMVRYMRNGSSPQVYELL